MIGSIFMHKCLYFLIFSVYFCGSAQQTQQVDFTRISAYLSFNVEEKQVQGTVECQFLMLKDSKTVYLDAPGYIEAKLAKSEKNIQLHYTDNKIVFEGDFKAGNTYTTHFTYSTQPKKALYFWGWDEKYISEKLPNHKQIWTQGQGKYTSHWLPSLDDMNDKISFDLRLKYDKNYRVLSNGVLVEKEAVGGEYVWHYQQKKPMSSYLVALAIGTYEQQITTSAIGVQLENYIYPERQSDFEATYRYHKDIFDFMQIEIGVPYPWENVYRQVPVRDFLYAGMENTGCTLFSDDFVIDTAAFEDQNLVSVSAHELAHQWFGNLVTETESIHHWLQEGFATFYALKTEKKLFGEDYYYFKLYESAEQLEAQNARDKGTPLVSDNGNSLTYYQHGAWALVALEDMVGTANFKKIIKAYLEEFKYKNATTKDFLKVATQVSKTDLSDYAGLWLYNKVFPTKAALELLTVSNFMKNYLQLAGQRTQPLLGKYVLLSEALDFPANPYLGQEVVTQLQGDSSPKSLSLYNKAFETGDPLIQLTLANTLTEIPKALEPKMKTLLGATSYATVEAALYNLWNNFDKNKAAYLKLTKNIEGFTSKNVRCLWLILALNTKGFSAAERADFFAELREYTATNANTRLRQNAFQYLELLNGFSDVNLIHLSLGATHPSWRFNQYCTQMIKRLLKKEAYRQRFHNLQKQLPTKVVNLISE